MKIKLCGTGTLSKEVTQYFTVGRSYEVTSASISDTVFDVLGDDGLTHSPAIFKDGTPCAYLEDCIGNLYWEIEE
tara:strand:- start:16515 stop:16739 length:225 start_codon:yes stop_codon:yes gene_type:complete